MSETFPLGVHANQVKFKMSGAEDQGTIILENLKILAEVLRTPRKLLSISDEKPLIDKDKEGLFIVDRFEESKTISGYIQTEQAFARKFPFFLKEGGLSFEFSPPKNEKLTHNFLSASRIYRFFAIGADTKVLELAFMPVSCAVQEQIQMAMEEEEEEDEDEEETKIMMAKDIEEVDMPMVFELLSELPSTCSISSSSAKILALEIKNLREEKAILEEKVQKIEADFLFQKNQVESYAEKNNALVSSLEEVKTEQRNQLTGMTNSLKKMETEAEERTKQMHEMMQAIRELQNNLEKEQTQKSVLESQLYKSKETMEQMKQEIEHLRLDNGELQNTVKQYEDTEAKRLKKVKKTAPVNASANIHLFPRQTTPNFGATSKVQVRVEEMSSNFLSQFPNTSAKKPTLFQKLKENQSQSQGSGLINKY